MDTQLKQRLVGLTVIFSLAVIFLPMLLDGSGLSPRQVEIEIPPAPVIDTGVKVEEKVIELEKKTAVLPDIEPLIVDEVSDPPVEAASVPADNEVVAANAKPAPKPAAKIEQKPASEPKKPAAVVPKTVKKAVESKAAKPAKKDKKPAVKKVAKQPEKTPVGGISWVIQTGSFQEKQKAYSQRDRIRKSRLAATFIEKYKHKGQLRYRVRMGPFLTRNKANIVRNKLRAKYNIKAILMKYEK